MTDHAYDYEEPDGTCHDCGQDLDSDPLGDHDDHHRQCWACWRGIEQPDDEGGES
jgi:hypothetical protein